MVLEQLRLFHAQAGELVDVEEAAIIDVVGSDAKMRSAPVLRPDQAVQTVRDPCSLNERDSARVTASARPAVRQRARPAPPSARRRARDHVGRMLGRPAKASPSRSSSGCSLDRGSRVIERADRQLVVRRPRRRTRRRLVERSSARRIPARRRIARRGRAPAACLADSRRPAPNRCRNSRRKRESWPHSRTSSHQVLSAPPTPMWFGTKSRIWPSPFAFSASTMLEIVFSAELGIERVVVDDVVAVRAAGARLQVWRRVDVADAERGEIGHEPAPLLEAEVLRELQTVGGARDRRVGVSGHCRRFRSETAGRTVSSDIRERSDAPVRRKLFQAERRLRRQFGCSSVVPGRLTWSVSSVRSSSCTMASPDRVRARKSCTASSELRA